MHGAIIKNVWMGNDYKELFTWAVLVRLTGLTCLIKILLWLKNVSKNNFKRKIGLI